MCFIDNLGLALETAASLVVSGRSYLLHLELRYNRKVHLVITSVSLELGVVIDRCQLVGHVQRSQGILLLLEPVEALAHEHVGLKVVLLPYSGCILVDAELQRR